MPGTCRPGWRVVSGVHPAFLSPLPELLAILHNDFLKAFEWQFYQFRPLSTPRPLPASAQSPVPGGSERLRSPRPVSRRTRHFHATECYLGAEEERRQRHAERKKPGTKENVPHGSRSTKSKNRPGFSTAVNVLTRKERRRSPGPKQAFSVLSWLERDHGTVT